MEHEQFDEVVTTRITTTKYSCACSKKYHDGYARAAKMVRIALELLLCTSILQVLELEQIVM
jgi:hypothetical protein